MKAITLWQPWASAIALGYKTIETRSWSAPKALIGQRIAIHAAQRYPAPFQGDRIGDFTFTEDIPLGAIVASAVLTDCVPTLDVDDELPIAWMRHVAPIHRNELWLWNGPSFTYNASTGQPTWLHDVITDQLPYGDFRPGRWAWLLDDIAPTTERCPACWGEGCFHEERMHGGGDVADLITGICSVCDRDGVCDPIPVKGHQRVWEWTP